MRLSPDKRSVKQFDALEPLNVLKAQGQKLGTLELSTLPGRPQVAVALATVVEDVRTRNAFCDVNLRFKAIDASVRCVWNRHNSAHAAPDSLCKQ
jgi:hypothetical protein